MASMVKMKQRHTTQLRVQPSESSLSVGIGGGGSIRNQDNSRLGDIVVSYPIMLGKKVRDPILIQQGNSGL